MLTSKPSLGVVDELPKVRHHLFKGVSYDFIVFRPLLYRLRGGFVLL